MNTNLPCDENERLAALHSYDILDTPPEPNFDEITHLTSQLFRTPISVINFIESDRQWFKSEVGLGVRETPLESSFCVHALLEQDMLVVPDAQEDPRFMGNPLVESEPHLRFYAGALLKASSGEPLGTLCILDYQPRAFDSAQQNALRVLANQVTSQLEQRKLLLLSEKNRATLLQLNKQLTDRERSKDEFLAMISHELRNPLSPIVMALEILKYNGPLPQDVDKQVQTIARQTKHLVRLVDDLLDSSRVTTGKISMDMISTHVKNVIERSLEIVKPAAENKRQHLCATFMEEDITIKADEVRICQALSNILINASRYTPEDGSIAVVVRPLDRAWVEIAISDTGIGISEDYLERIFESFVQVPRATGSAGGLGIGLHLCKHIVHLHNGEIAVTSDGLGKGSTFTVRLPMEKIEDRP